MIYSTQLIFSYKRINITQLCVGSGRVGFDGRVNFWLLYLWSYYLAVGNQESMDSTPIQRWETREEETPKFSEGGSRLCVVLRLFLTLENHPILKRTRPSSLGERLGFPVAGSPPIAFGALVISIPNFTLLISCL